MIDTAGFADSSALGDSRLNKTRLAAEKSDIAVILISADEAAQFIQSFPEEAKWHQIFIEKNTPVLFVVSKADVCTGTEAEGAPGV